MSAKADRPGEDVAGAALTDYGRRYEAALTAARAFIRLRFEEDGCVIDIREVLEHLDEAFGDEAGLMSDVRTVLNLCVDLRADPSIHQVGGGWMEFYWDGPGRRLHGVSRALHARMHGHSAPKELP